MRYLICFKYNCLILLINRVIREQNITEQKQVSHPLIIIGKTLSTVSTSLENRFKILPTGVTSKKVLHGALITLANNKLCNKYAPFNEPTNKVIAEKTILRAENRHIQNNL